MRRYLLLVLTLSFAACAAPHRAIRSVAFGDELSTLAPQEVMEERGDRPKSYVSIGGGINQQSTNSSSSTDTDTDTVNLRLGGGYRPNHSIDIGVANDIFLTSTSTAGFRTKSRVNNISASCNFMLNENSETEFYAGPNLGLYMAKVKGTGFSVSSTEPSYGFQAGMRHWMSSSSALKVEWRNVWSRQDNFGGGGSDVHQMTILVSFDVWF